MNNIIPDGVGVVSIEHSVLSGSLSGVKDKSGIDSITGERHIV